MLRALIDPNVAPVRSASREERDLFIAASNGHLLAFDNLSHLPAWTSDALCRLASGGSFATRRSIRTRMKCFFRQPPDRAEWDRKRDHTAGSGRPDDFCELSYVPDHRRRPEAQIWADFEAARPQILGALLDAVAHGLSAFTEVRLERLLRMADFAVWSTACDQRSAVSRMLTRQTGAPPSRRWSTPIRLRLASAI
jgi:hypothetical protein